MRKAIVIVSAVISMLSSIGLTISTVYTLVEALRYGLYEYHALDRGPAGNFIISIIMELLILFISILVMFNIKLPKLLRIFNVIISVIIVLFSFLLASIIIYATTVGNTWMGSEVLTAYLLVQIAVIITLLTYIRRALKPKQK